ncbi:hypothetical protein [Chryseobacterium sp.]|uniref:glycosyltransferase family protein n=1 Tax=Chryseobacterium sp. TaxID=1871047 RepID=UPI0011C7E836|nr:hypothetical protein [Chryseobacterium sp.]TXF77221.1 hypothetical protein FUA25_04585 [Chryseobacterium sp.]
MKICLISFDFWNYDQHIVETLRKKGIEAHHINIGAYKHRNSGARVKNAMSKIFLKKNLKNINRQELILEKLKKLGKQDKILVINPEAIGRKYHLEIRKFTDEYIAYLYDSTLRNPVDKVIDLFDSVFSFDKKDIEKYGFKETSNYNYLAQKHPDPQHIKYDLFYLGSYDERINLLYDISKKMDAFGLKSRFVIVGKKTWKKNLPFNEENSNFVFTSKRIPHSEIPKYYETSKVILDLVREHQSGLSFRIFEAMALNRKIITANQYVKHYDFYNPNNILVLNEDLSNLEKTFFETDYETIPEEIYRKYTLENWVNTVFRLSL